MLQARTQFTSQHEIVAHVIINGNKQANAVAERGCKLAQRHVAAPYEHAHPTRECL